MRPGEWEEQIVHNPRLQLESVLSAGPLRVVSGVEEALPNWLDLWQLGGGGWGRRQGQLQDAVDALPGGAFSSPLSAPLFHHPLHSILPFLSILFSPLSPSSSLSSSPFLSFFILLFNIMTQMLMPAASDIT